MEPGFVFHWLEIMIEDEEVEEIDTALLLDNIVKGEGCDDELVGCSAAPAPSSSGLQRHGRVEIWRQKVSAPLKMDTVREILSQCLGTLWCPGIAGEGRDGDRRAGVNWEQLILCFFLCIAFFLLHGLFRLSIRKPGFYQNICGFLHCRLLWFYFS